MLASCGGTGRSDPDAGIGGSGGNSAGAGGSGGSAGEVTAGAGAGGVPSGAGVGQSCADTEECRLGLVCSAGQCEPGGATGEGEPCTISAECADGLFCASGVCRPAGSGGPGAACAGDADCQSRLRCEVSGFGLKCVPEGSVDVGGTCTSHADCFGALACHDGTCQRDSGGLIGRALSFSGVDCEDVAAGAPTRAYFEVPGAEPPGLIRDFFRLPFPNDVRRKPGGLDLAGFPTPGSALLGFDPVQRYVEALGSDAAWGTYPTVYFRFSAPIDFASLRDGDLIAENDPLLWIDITPGSPNLGANDGTVYSLDPNRAKYICENALGVRRWNGVPLLPGHTYAVWLTTAVRDTLGQPLERSPHLTAVLAPTPPEDPVLLAAHAAYAPLREYFAGRGVATDTILNAAVFTAGPVQHPMAEMAELVSARAVPASSNWVRCGGTESSPCPQADGDRACVAGPAEYDEYHALVSVPVFQRGTPPYLTPEDGGDIDASSMRAEAVCVSLTIPKGTAMPAEGWPLVVTAHGTGGSFRSHVRPEIAGALSRVTTSAGEVRFAVLGFDQVQHGPRRGTSTESPDNLFFNFTNPKAARGNPLQGAVDQVAMGLFARSLDLDAPTTGGDAIRINPNAVVFFGHSQGATHGSMALPFADTYRAAVLSGNGASLMHALLNKTQPVDIAGALPLVLGDLDLLTGRLPGQPEFHPALALLQQWSDPVDPLNFARSIATAPLSGHTAKHLFQTYGQGDSFAPPITLATFAIAAGLPQAAPDPTVGLPDEIFGAPPAAGPLGTPNPSGVVVGVRQYAPAAGSDGHFVVFDVPSANADVARFLALAALGQTPVIGQ